jgi:hypothetical protein
MSREFDITDRDEVEWIVNNDARSEFRCIDFSRGPGNLDKQRVYRSLTRNITRIMEHDQIMAVLVGDTAEYFAKTDLEAASAGYARHASGGYHRKRYLALDPLPPVSFFRLAPHHCKLCGPWDINGTCRYKLPHPMTRHGTANL